MDTDAWSGLTPALADVRPFAPYLFEWSGPDGQPLVRIFADDDLLAQIRRDHSLNQLINVRTLPGIVGPVLGMPDMHEGYGFPVGGVAATRYPDGAISPGGIGFDINCGVRLLACDVTQPQIEPVIERLVHEISRSIPSGFGRSGRLALDDRELDRVLQEGCRFMVHDRRFGVPADLEHIESGGSLSTASAAAVSDRAKERGREQLGTLGGGNHFLEVQAVAEIFDEAAARVLGIHREQVTVMIHTGSRGLGHQVCTDYVRLIDQAMPRYGITVPDRQLACVPLSAREGRDYFAAMSAAANFGWCNRQVITHHVRQVFDRIFADRAEARLRLVYDVAHNTAKIERRGAELSCVHRKGATRAFGPEHDDVPKAYRAVGQPVLIPGSMGTSSYVLVGTQLADDLSLGSACHGAGRAMSRAAAKRAVQGHVLRRELEARGLVVRCPSNAELAEEAPAAYKDVDRVVDVVHGAGIARKVARLRPLGIVKG